MESRNGIRDKSSCIIGGDIFQRLLLDELHRTIPCGGSPGQDAHDVAAQALLAWQGVMTETGRRGGLLRVVFSIVAFAKVGCSYIIAHNQIIASSNRK